MKFSEKDKEILHSYVDNSCIDDIVNYIEDNFGSSRTRYIKTLNEENENFDGTILIKNIEELIELNHDDPDNVDIGDLVNELEIAYIEDHYLRDEEKEMIYCDNKVTFILENVPNIIYEKFNKVSYALYSTITEYIIYNNDLENLKLVNKILNKDKKIFKNVIESELNSIIHNKDILDYFIEKDVI